MNNLLIWLVIVTTVVSKTLNFFGYSCSLCFFIFHVKWSFRSNSDGYIGEFLGANTTLIRSQNVTTTADANSPNATGGATSSPSIVLFCWLTQFLFVPPSFSSQPSAQTINMYPPPHSPPLFGMMPFLLWFFLLFHSGSCRELYWFIDINIRSLSGEHVLVTLTYAALE